jgi:4-hydroxythreonine-4-phosphate dehydrogenase
LKDQKNKIKVGFTTGDMNGIGPEILLNSLKNAELLTLCTPVIYGPIKNLNYVQNHFSFDLTFNKISSVEELQNGKINVVDNFKNSPEISFGILNKKIGAAAFESIRNGVKDLKDGRIDVLVTPPINKEAIHSDEFKFMGHTDYIDSEINGSSTMMMVSYDLRVALLTEHIPISKVTDSITVDYVENKINALNETLMRDFQIERPKIAVLSIDPHAGDGGVIAENDKKLIVPAIQNLYDSGILAYGPFSADSFFGTDHYKKFDLIVATYHDQGLIPFKTLSFGMGVNYTSGLDKIRTSPDHGTAYSIAGKGVASIDSFLCSIYLAIDIYRRRKIYDRFSKNRLETSQ